MWLSIRKAVEFGNTESCQNGKVTLSILIVDLDHASYEKLLLFCGPSFPVVWLGDGHGETFVSSPLLALRLFLVGRVEVDVVLNRRQLFHGPRLSNRKGAVGVLPSFVQLDSACVAHGYHDDSRLLV